MILFCSQILWVRYLDQAEQRCLACLCSTMSRGQAGTPWMGEIDSNSWAGIIWRLLHSWSERLNQTYHLHVSCPSQKFKGSWNYWDHSSFCLLGKDWAGTPLKRLWISVMEKQCWLDIRFKLTSGHTGDRYWVLNYPGILWQVRAIKNVS